MKEDVLGVLREWTLHYLQNKDLITRSIVNIDKNKDGWDLVVSTKTEPRFVLVLPDLAALVPSLDKVKDKNSLIVTLNKRQNVDTLVSLWPQIVAHPKLTLVFVNPYSTLEKKWIIVPYVHERIIERKALKLGLDSLFMTVEEYTG
jgi:hypothetical protein